MKVIALAVVLCVPLQAHAGGPVIIEEPYENLPTPALSPAEKIALAAGLILVGAFILGSGGSDDCACNTRDEGGQCVC